MASLAMSGGVAASGSPVELRAASEGEAPQSPQPKLGVLVDAGFPDGIGASVLVAPARGVRLQLGGLTNGLASGVRFGLTLYLLPSFFEAVRPGVVLETGWAFDNRAAWAARLVPDAEAAAVLASTTARFASAQVGLEFGSRYFSLVLRGGVAWLEIAAENPAAVSALLASVGLRRAGLVPTGKLGIMVCFG